MREDDRARRERLYDEGVAAAIQNLDTPAHLAATAIVDCGLCDDDGYRGAYVCDHIDHAAATEQARAHAREVAANLRRKTGHR